MNATLLNQIIDLRHELHSHPELSGKEIKTAKLIRLWLEQCSPTQIIHDIGGPGVAAIFDSNKEGPSVLFRCELDALPIFEVGQPEWRSVTPGIAHLCGHDGHMAIIAGLAKLLSENPPIKGRVILLFQPAEETGAGARAVIQDEKFALIQSDFAFALHNLPGMKMGEVGIKSGPFNFASEGLSIHLTGHTSHASHPEDGNSPASAMTELINALPEMPKTMGLTQKSALVTVVHARLGTEDFGISPGDGSVMATIRSIDDNLQKDIIKRTEELVRIIAKKHNLQVEISNADKFAACTNDGDATQIMQTVLEKFGMTHKNLNTPFRWSEDFGVFGSTTKSTFCVLGAGHDSPQLHNPDYDFPDELIKPGIRLFNKIARELCG